VLEIGRILSVEGGEGLGTGALVSGGEPIPAGKSTGRERQFEMGLEGRVGSFFSRESTLSKRPTCFQMISSAWCIRVFDRESILYNSWGTTPGPLKKDEQRMG